MKLSKIYYHFVKENQGDGIIDKTPGHIFYWSSILNTFPSAKIVFCTRPAIEVLASYKKRMRSATRKNELQQSEWLNIDIAAFISRYEDYHLSALDCINKNPDNIFVLEYNSLVFRDQNVLNKLAGFLHISIEDIYSNLDTSSDTDTQKGLLFGGVQQNVIEVDKYLSENEKTRLYNIDFNFISKTN